MRGRDSSVCTATSYRLKDRCSVPVKVKMSLFFMWSRTALRPTQHPVQLVPVNLFPWGVKQYGREADRSPESSAEVENGEGLPPLPIRLHGIVLEE
jgi:hypothetical protein